MPIESWGELGVAGLCVAGCFWLMWQLVKRTDRMADSHRDERKEWRKSADQNSDKVQRALDDLAGAIRRMHK